MTSVQVFLARPSAGAFEREFKPESQFDLAGRIEIDEGPIAVNNDRATVLLAIAELVFAMTNSYPGEYHVGPEYHDQVIAWRAGRNRSLSTGDVLAIGEAFYFCASSGWQPIERCSHNLMAAFIIGNPTKEPS